MSSFFFSWQSHSEWSTFLTTFVHICSHLFTFVQLIFWKAGDRGFDSRTKPQIFYVSKSRCETKALFRFVWFFSFFFRHYATLFRKFSDSINCIFLKFSVCKNVQWAWMASFWVFVALCDFLKKILFSKKNSQIIFSKKKNSKNFNSCSLNIFEPKIWRRLGTFPSCCILNCFDDVACNVAR